MTPDEEFLEELRAAFQIEASEHLQSIGAALLEVEKAPTAAPASLIETISRDAHSLKGAARAVDAVAIERICQPLEDVFSAWKYGELLPAPNQFTPIYQALDVIEGLLGKPMTGEISAQVSAVIKQIQSIKTGNVALLPTVEVPSEETESEPLEKSVAVPESAAEPEEAPEELPAVPVKPQAPIESAAPLPSALSPSTRKN